MRLINSMSNLIYVVSNSCNLRAKFKKSISFFGKIIGGLRPQNPNLKLLNEKHF